MDVIRNHIGDIVTLTAVILLLYLCIRSLYQSKKTGLPSCACGKTCATCALRYVHGMAEKKA